MVPGTGYQVPGTGGQAESTVRRTENRDAPQNWVRIRWFVCCDSKSSLLSTRFTCNKNPENPLCTNQRGCFKLCCKAACASILFIVPTSFMITLYACSIYTAYSTCQSVFPLGAHFLLNGPPLAETRPQWTRLGGPMGPQPNLQTGPPGPHWMY
jgi:hypothetical protein